MTLWDFLYQASFWQWLGLTVLALLVLSWLDHVVGKLTNRW